jgi:hypothetical protein
MRGDLLLLTAAPRPGYGRPWKSFQLPGQIVPTNVPTALLVLIESCL